MSEKLITESIVEHSKVLESLDQDTIGKAAQLIVKSIHNNSKIFWCGKWRECLSSKSSFC